MNRKVLLRGLCLILLVGISPGIIHSENRNMQRAKETMERIYRFYAVGNSPLLRENYPFVADYKAGYLAGEDKTPQKKVAYLWPFSGTFSALNALMKAGEKEYTRVCKERFLPGLKMYYDSKRTPACYQSYLAEAGYSDRFYDDNVWLGIDFAELYHATHSKIYLKQAREIWHFIDSGTDDKLGGGVYWCEQKKHSKNTCSNAPGAVLALKLYGITRNKKYLIAGQSLYAWTKSNLQDPTDLLYFDNKSLDGKIGKAKFAYNSGQMLQAAVLLYKITKDKSYLEEAESVAKASINYFAEPFQGRDGKEHRLFIDRNAWFVAVMLRGFVELYSTDRNPEYLKVYQDNLDYAWDNARDADGLFYGDWSLKRTDKEKWLLTQAAMVEMYGSLAGIKL